MKRTRAHARIHTHTHTHTHTNTNTHTHECIDREWLESFFCGILPVSISAALLRKNVAPVWMSHSPVPTSTPQKRSENRKWNFIATSERSKMNLFTESGSLLAHPSMCCQPYRVRWRLFSLFRSGPPFPLTTWSHQMVFAWWIAPPCH